MPFQVEMTGSSIFDYIHRQDQQEMAEQLGLNLPQGSTMPSPSSAGSDDGRPGSTPRPSTPTVPERGTSVPRRVELGYSSSTGKRMTKEHLNTKEKSKYDHGNTRCWLLHRCTGLQCVFPLIPNLGSLVIP